MRNRNGQVNRNPEAGLTLIEVSVAAGILLVTVVLLMGNVVNISRTSDVVSTQAVATGHVNTVLEEVHGLDFPELLAYVPPAMSGLGNTEQVEVYCLDESGEAHRLPIENEELAARLPNPVEVQVLVKWHTAQGHEYKRRASILVGR